MDLVPNFWCHKDFRKVSRLFALLALCFAFVLCPRMVLMYRLAGSGANSGPGPWMLRRLAR